MTTSNIRLFEVGGSIRDDLLGLTDIPDRDFCAESPDGWEALLAWCHDNMKRVFLVTPEFLTVRGMMPNGTAIDVVMCRKDGPSSDGRHPDHVSPGSLMDDLKRRDFTVNAMAREVDPATLEPIGDLIDPFEGRRDLLQRRLRSVGNTSDRLKEDGLRVLRAARFSVTKDLFLTPELSACLQESEWWDFVNESVSPERVREELHKMFKFNSARALLFLVHNCSPRALILLGEEGNGIWLKPTMEKK